MKVKDLMEKLREFPPEMEVLRGDSDWPGVRIRTLETGIYLDRMSANCLRSTTRKSRPTRAMFESPA